MNLSNGLKIISPWTSAFSSTSSRKKPDQGSLSFPSAALMYVIAIGFCAFAPVSAADPTGLVTTEDVASQPNIIVIYADDLGFGDLSCYNSESAYKTPRLDKMAAEGIRFTDAHSPSTICSPSRYGLFSGQQIYRSTGRGGGAFEGPGGPSYLKPGTLTIGEMLKQKGYRTGVFGKWHVGLSWFDKEGKRLGGGFKTSLLIDYEKSTPLIDGPQARGFDKSFVTPNCPNTDPLYCYIEDGMVAVPASQRHKRDTLPNPGGKWRWDNDEGWMAPGYDFMNADLLFYDKTEEFIKDHRKTKSDQPFFAVLSTQIAHAPVLPAEEFNGATEAGPRGDFVWELDVIVGRVLDLVQELGIDDNTLILFNSDNGAETLHVDWMRKDHNHDASGGWRGMKRDGWEGGHRVPMIARWPGSIPAGQVSNQMTNTTDIFATVASAVGYELPDDAATDSFDMLPVMLGKQEDSNPVRPHLLTQSFRGEFQIRQGAWKYLDHKGSGGNGYEKGNMLKYAIPETAPDAPGQLYNLDADPGETTNLYFKNEAKRQELQVLLKRLKESGRSAPLGRVPFQR
ncbi:MAG: arylsulfatase [Fuerstiella sp.]